MKLEPEELKVRFSSVALFDERMTFHGITVPSPMLHSCNFLKATGFLLLTYVIENRRDRRKNRKRGKT
jgi:hypothetical protein